MTATGDDCAFDALYLALSARVFGIARQVVRSPAQAEEVAQEAFTDVWRTAAKYDADRASAATWVLTIAHRRAVDHVRSAQASSDREKRHAFLNARFEFDEVVEEVERRVEAQQVRESFGALTDLQRESVMLAYYGGLTYAAVASFLDVPLSTVKTRIRDGLLRMRDCLASPHDRVVVTANGPRLGGRSAQNACPATSVDLSEIRRRRTLAERASRRRTDQVTR